MLEILKHLPPWEWPDDAGKALLDVLRDRGAEDADRLLAAAMAADIVVIDDQLVETLLSMVQDPSEPEKLRGRAAISLGPILELRDMEEFDEFEDEFDEFDEFNDVPVSDEALRHIQEVFQRLYTDASLPNNVRRSILEASVRAPQDWHRNAVRAAYESGDEDWELTAVFCMRWIRGFDEQILEALSSENEQIHYEAVCAAGNWGIDAAWHHVKALIPRGDTDKDLLLAAIDAVAGIRPEEARSILFDLTGSHDKDIVDAAMESIAMIEAGFDEDDADEDYFA